MAYDLLAWKAWAANATTDEIAEILVQKSEAVRVLAEELVELERLYAKGTAIQRPCGYFLAASVMSNPIAAEAVRKAGG